MANKIKKESLPKKEEEVGKIVETNDIKVGDFICLKSNYDIGFMLFFQANKRDVRDMTKVYQFVKIVKN